MVKGRPKGSSTNNALTVARLSVWAQCDNQNCQKWRRLPPGSVVDDSIPWFCYMNPDELRNSCEAPEESYNEDIEDYQMVEEPNIQISSDDEDTAAHGSWRGGTAKQGAKRKQGADVGGSRGRGRGAAKQQPQVKPEPQYWAPAPAPGAKRQRTGRIGEDNRSLPNAADEPQPPRLHSEASLPGSAQKLPRGAAKVLKAHGAFQKLVAGAGSWDAARGRLQAVQMPPQHAWEGLAQFAPEAAELACHGLDVASAQSYFALPGGAPRGLQAGGAQRTARLALMMAAAAAADSAAGVFHASISQPSPQAAQGPPPVHSLAGLPTRQVPALPGNSAAGPGMLGTSGLVQGLPGSSAGLPTGPAAGYARPAALGPAQGMLGRLGMAPGMPTSLGVSAAAAQHTVQAPVQASAAASLGPDVLFRASPAPGFLGQPMQGAGGMQSAAFGFSQALAGQAPGSHSMSSSAHFPGRGVPAMPWPKLPRSLPGGEAAAASGSTSAPQHQPDMRQANLPSSNAPFAQTAAQGRPGMPVQQYKAVIPPPSESSAGPRPPAVSLGPVQSGPASSNGALGYHMHAGLPAPSPLALEGKVLLSPMTSSQATPQLSEQNSSHSQAAQGRVHKADCSTLQKSGKGSEGNLREVQADSSGKAQPSNHGTMNGHHHNAYVRDLPNGAYEQGGVREKASQEHEQAKSEHGHASSEGRPPEVEAGCS